MQELIINELEILHKKTERKVISLLFVDRLHCKNIFVIIQ